MRFTLTLKCKDTGFLGEGQTFVVMNVRTPTHIHADTQIGTVWAGGYLGAKELYLIILNVISLLF